MAARLYGGDFEGAQWDAIRLYQQATCESMALARTLLAALAVVLRLEVADLQGDLGRMERERPTALGYEEQLGGRTGNRGMF